MAITTRRVKRAPEVLCLLFTADLTACALACITAALKLRPTWFAGGVSLAVSGALITYVIRNGSGHTGFEPWLLSVVFVTSLLVGFAAVFFRRSRTAAIVACAAGIVGLTLLFYLDRYGVLLRYDRWFQRGMP